MITSPRAQGTLHNDERALTRTRTPSAAVKPCQAQLWKGPWVVPGPLPPSPGEGLCCLHPQPGRRGQGPISGSPGCLHVVRGSHLPWRSPRPAGLWVIWPSSPNPPSTHRPQARPGFRSCRHHGLGGPQHTWFQSAGRLDEWRLVRALQGLPPHRMGQVGSLGEGGA